MSRNACINRSILSRWCLPLLLLPLAGGLRAAEGDALQWRVSQSLYYEDNLYRLADGASAPEGQRDDTISLTSLGLSFDREYSRQRLRADVDLSHAAYAAHDNLDYTAPDVSVAWDWRLGNHWSGTFSHAYAESLAGFEDVAGTDQVIRLRTRSGVSANYWWHPDWAIGVGMSRVQNRYQDNARPASENDTRAVDLNLTYRPATGNRVVLTLRQTDGRYPNRPAVAGSIREYTQRDGRIAGDWRLTGALRLSGDVGFTERRYDLAPSRDFTGVTGRVAANWQPTAKTSVELSWRREIGAEEDLVSNYAVTRVLRLAPRWAITDKMSLGGFIERSSRDYGGDPELGFDGLVPVRDDTSRRYGLTLSYQPIRALSLSLGVQHQRRSSDIASREYEADSAWVSGTFIF